eukprot:1161739-Pelagomonas_calceolata.AAC.2
MFGWLVAATARATQGLTVAGRGGDAGGALTVAGRGGARTLRDGCKGEGGDAGGAWAGGVGAEREGGVALGQGVRVGLWGAPWGQRVLPYLLVFLVAVHAGHAARAATADAAPQP